jgi:predicted metal-binding protein
MRYNSLLKELENIDFKYYTNNKREFNIKIRSKEIPVKDILQFENKSLFDDMCKSGCKNYNKKCSCPPYSPSFTVYSKNYDMCKVYLMYIDMKQFNYFNGHGYFKVKVGNGILKPLMDKMLFNYSESKNGRIITSGSCRSCNKCGLPCKKPNKRIYSFESMGINVSELSEFIFNHKLLWYKNKTIPEYTSILSGYLFKGDKNG